MDLRITGASGLRGHVKVPGDKSISHRAALLGAIAEGRTAIRGFLRAGDSESTLWCLRQLGVEIEETLDGVISILGGGLRGFREPDDVLDAGNSGTTLRILPGLLAGQEFCSILTGDASLRRRPMKRVVEPLRRMGARIMGRAGGTLAPLVVDGVGHRLRGIEVQSSVSSAQVKTAILLAGLYARGETLVIEPAKSRDHTERMLRLFGVDIVETDNIVGVAGDSILQGTEVDVPGDLSSAAFFAVASAVTRDSELVLEGVGLNPTRAGFLEVMHNIGADFAVSSPRTVSNEPRGDITVRSSRPRTISLGGSLIPKVIDELPVVALALTQADGKSLVRDAAELRVKECDRISALAEELGKMGAKISEREDGWDITGPAKLRGAEVDSHGDHRIAMTLAVAGLIASGETVVRNAGCIDISYPGYGEELRRLAGLGEEPEGSGEPTRAGEEGAAEAGPAE